MKKALSSVLIITVLLSFTACGLQDKTDIVSELGLTGDKVGADPSKCLFFKKEITEKSNPP